jgi:hypothetical protein
VQPMCQLLFWSRYNDRLALMMGLIVCHVWEWKPDNLRVRLDGSMAVVDLGSAATFTLRLIKRGVPFVESKVERGMMQRLV